MVYLIILSFADVNQNSGSRIVYPNVSEDGSSIICDFNFSCYTKNINNYHNLGSVQVK